MFNPCQAMSGSCEKKHRDFEGDVEKNHGGDAHVYANSHPSKGPEDLKVEKEEGQLETALHWPIEDDLQIARLQERGQSTGSGIKSKMSGLTSI